MTWGSASADRSIIASTPLPRTPVTPPERAGTPGHPRGRATGACLQASRARSLASDLRRSSEHRTRFHPGRHPTSSEARVGFHRGKADGALRSTARRASPEHDQWHPSGRRPSHSTGTGNPELFGAPAPPSRPRPESPALKQGPPAPRGRRAELFGASSSAPRWSRAARALRSAGQPVPRAREPAALRSRRPPSPPEARQPVFLGSPRAGPHREAPPHRDESPAPWGRVTALFGAPRPASRDPADGLFGAPPPGSDRAPLLGAGARGAGNRSSSEPRAPRLTRGLADGTPRRAASRASPETATAPLRRNGSSSRPRGRERPISWGQATGALRSPARRASPGPRRRRSSESREQSLTGPGNPELFGAQVTPS
jgi:hypothetical protein